MNDNRYFFVTVEQLRKAYVLPGFSTRVDAREFLRLLLAQLWDMHGSQRRVFDVCRHPVVRELAEYMVPFGYGRWMSDAEAADFFR